MDRFELVAPFTPQGDQPAAIRQLTEGIEAGTREQVLLGVTGSGKTFTIAKVVAAVNRPTLVLSHNKTLAAQLFQEFRSFFPDNAVEYFVSYYDYYQPEAYVPQSDTYIEKEATINEEIDRLRLRATKSLFERRDVLIVASVSCIYGLGSPEAFYGMLQFFRQGDEGGLDAALRQLVEMQYARTQIDLFPGSFRARGDVLEILPAYEERGIRIEFFGDEIERLARFDVLTGDELERVDQVAVFPKTHYVTPRERMLEAITAIRGELAERLAQLEAEGKLLERQRLEQRTRFDLEMLREIGYCHGIENYSRHLSGRAPGRAAADAARLPAGGLPADRRREPPVDPAGARHVPRRPLAQGDPGRARLPPAQRPRQPAADLRGVRGARAASGSTSRPRPAPWELEQRRRRRGRAGGPPDRAARPGDRGAAGPGPGRRPARARCGRWSAAASGCWSPR